MYVYLSLCVYMYMCVYIYIYIYIYKRSVRQAVPPNCPFGETSENNTQQIKQYKTISRGSSTPESRAPGSTSPLSGAWLLGIQQIVPAHVQGKDCQHSYLLIYKL